MADFKEGYYAIHAFEGCYGGLHGMYDLDIIHANKYDELDFALYEMAHSVWESYCEDEYPEEELEADGEWFFLGENFSKEELDKLKEEQYNLGMGLFREKYEVKE